MKLLKLKTNSVMSQGTESTFKISCISVYKLSEKEIKKAILLQSHKRMKLTKEIKGTENCKH